MYGLTDEESEMADKSLVDREKLHTKILHRMTDTYPLSPEYIDLKITLTALSEGLPQHDGFNR